MNSIKSLKKLNKNLYLASPRGFCAGVERAIKIVEKTIKIYDLYGKIVVSKNTIKDKTSMDLNSLGQGLYLLQISNSDEITTHSIVKN